MSQENLYTLLGCDATSTSEQILAEYRARVREIHPDKMEATQKAEAERLFHELTYAKDILSDPSKRQHYDLFLRMGGPLNLTLKEWMENQDKLQQTLHWATHAAESTPMLEPSTSSNVTPSTCKSELEEAGSFVAGERHYPRRFEGWTSHNSPVINAFRNYKI
ncbi:dnaJ domain-containing protein [Ditylenchus destructor]|nr:dnaJ domain-containing protein [Ditylenchus destructor]